MNQHRIPQEISSYEFRLVGNMTLRQFGKMAAGVVAATLFYSSGLIFLWKFLGISISLAAGFAFAFVPVNEKPLEFFIWSFIKSVYSPTIYLWQRTGAAVNVSPLVEQSRRASFFQKITVKDKTPKIAEFVKTLPQQQKEGLLKKTIEPSVPSPASSPVAVDGGQTLSWNQLAGFWKNGSSNKGKTKEAQFLGPSLPDSPTVPNLINGLVIDGDGNEIEGAIVEIQDIDGNPARAMRTNGLGQFQTATPLPEGDYLIVVEKEPFNFDIIKLKVEGKIIPPIRIQSRKELPAHG